MMNVLQDEMHNVRLCAHRNLDTVMNRIFFILVHSKYTPRVEQHLYRIDIARATRKMQRCLVEFVEHGHVGFTFIDEQVQYFSRAIFGRLVQQIIAPMINARVRIQQRPMIVFRTNRVVEKQVKNVVKFVANRSKRNIFDERQVPVVAVLHTQLIVQRAHVLVVDVSHVWHCIFGSDKLFPKHVTFPFMRANNLGIKLFTKNLHGAMNIADTHRKPRIAFGGNHTHFEVATCKQVAQKTADCEQFSDPQQMQ
mmetsp:Transcript_36190/g.59440  ORF Transcript_36190/g.59440 Transcript_36190/m.59440 type:complete len:252 (-) Transcript_36190:250-1005(-)